MQSGLSKPTKGRLKRSSFIRHSRILERQQPELPDHMPEPIQTHASAPCWESQKFPNMFTRIPSIEKTAAHQILREHSLPWSILVPTTQRRSEHRSTLMDLSLKLPGMEVEGVYIKYRAEKAHISVTARRYATNIKAEVMTLTTAATQILANLDKTHKKVVFFSDAFQYLMF